MGSAYKGVCIQGVGQRPIPPPPPGSAYGGGGGWADPSPPQGLPQEGWADPPTPRLKKAGGTHPTGMLSCYHPQTKLQKRNVFTPVCQSFCLKGGSLPQCMLGYTPPGRHPPSQHSPSRRPLQRTVRMLLECFLV